MASTYIVKSFAVPYALSKNMLTLFNPAASGRVVRVYRVWVENNQMGPAVTGVNAVLKLFRCTAASGGVACVPISYNSTNTSLSTVIAGTGMTATVSSLFRNYNISNDEPTAMTGTCDEWQQYTALTEIWNSGSRNPAIEPIVCQAGQGVSLQNSTSTTVGNIDVFFEFTVT